jgi:regulator of replication initiation timing
MVTAIQDNELETMSTELHKLREENDAIKQENLRLNQKLDEQIKLTTDKAMELEQLGSEMNMFDGLHEASTVCYKL